MSLVSAARRTPGRGRPHQAVAEIGLVGEVEDDGEGRGPTVAEELPAVVDLEPGRVGLAAGLPEELELPR